MQVNFNLGLIYISSFLILRSYYIIEKKKLVKLNYIKAIYIDREMDINYHLWITLYILCEAYISIVCK